MMLLNCHSTTLFAHIPQPSKTGVEAVRKANLGIYVLASKQPISTALDVSVFKEYWLLMQCWGKCLFSFIHLYT